jgi:hypothetical protein
MTVTYNWLASGNQSAGVAAAWAGGMSMEFARIENGAVMENPQHRAR